jgi:hypothetical protein
MMTTDRPGLLSRFFSRAAPAEPQAPASGGFWADNATRPVQALIKGAYRYCDQ